MSEKSREILKEIFKQHANIIENKKTDAVSNKAKEAAWLEIAKQFNGCTRISESRTAPQLKKLWQNMKCAAREQKTKQRQNTFATGGGPAEEVDTSIIDEVGSIAPHLMISLSPTMDSDFLPAETSGVVNRLTEHGSVVDNVSVVNNITEIPESSVQIQALPEEFSIIGVDDNISEGGTTTGSSSTSRVAPQALIVIHILRSSEKDGLPYHWPACLMQPKKSVQSAPSGKLFSLSTTKNSSQLNSRLLLQSWQLPNNAWKMKNLEKSFGVKVMVHQCDKDVNYLFDV